MTVKQTVLETVRAMPDEATLDQILENIEIMAALREGLADIQAGRVHSLDEVKQMIISWRTT